MRFGDIWTPRQPKDGKGTPKFNATFLLDPKKNKEEVKAINDAIKKVAKEKWKDKSTRILSSIEGDRMKMCYFEEDMIDEDGEDVEGCEGMFFIRSNNETQPSLLDRDRTELTRADGRPYKGCYVVAKLDIWAQDNIHGKGIRAELRGIQFMRDGDPFGGGSKAKADEFEDLSDLGEDDDDEAPAPKKRRVVEEDDTPTPPKRKRRPVEDDDDDIG
jgi:hypothetical protein